MGTLSASDVNAAERLDRYRAVRAQTERLAEPITAEDATIQSMPDASPVKWHLAHTGWFFEQFVLASRAGFRPYRPQWAYLFNSYYEAVGARQPRHLRGLLSRPTLREVIDYRHAVDEQVRSLLAGDPDDATAWRIDLGLQHEQQHQELILTDLKHLFSCNPLRPAYRTDLAAPRCGAAVPSAWLPGDAGIIEIGHAGDGFGFDCEMPRHRELLQSHAVASRPVSNGEFRQFVRDGGYQRPQLWLADGWDAVQRNGWHGPAYWLDDGESEFTLGGVRAIDPLAPVCHVSGFEADAFARWAGARLPSEAEWESLATRSAAVASADAHFSDREVLQPQAPMAADGPLQLFGDVWEWTASPFVPYPGFKPADGAIGEYNGKFMSGQWVLRGGSCASPAGHLRATYRNFFRPSDRWQFSGIRLAQDR